MYRATAQARKCSYFQRCWVHYKTTNNNVKIRSDTIPGWVSHRSRDGAFFTNRIYYSHTAKYNESARYHVFPPFLNTCPLSQAGCLIGREIRHFSLSRYNILTLRKTRGPQDAIMHYLPFLNVRALCCAIDRLTPSPASDKSSSENGAKRSG